MPGKKTSYKITFFEDEKDKSKKKVTLEVNSADGEEPKEQNTSSNPNTHRYQAGATIFSTVVGTAVMIIFYYLMLEHVAQELSSSGLTQAIENDSAYKNATNNCVTNLSQEQCDPIGDIASISSGVAANIINDKLHTATVYTFSFFLGMFLISKLTELLNICLNRGAPLNPDTSKKSDKVIQKPDETTPLLIVVNDDKKDNKIDEISIVSLDDEEQEADKKDEPPIVPLEQDDKDHQNSINAEDIKTLTKALKELTTQLEELTKKDAPLPDPNSDSESETEDSSNSNSPKTLTNSQ